MPEVLIPLILVVAAALVTPRHWLAGDRRRPLVVWTAMAVVGLVIARYLYWRLTETLPLNAEIGVAESVFVWTLLAIEMAAWCDTAIFFLTLSRPRDNSAGADAGERALRATSPGALPHIDVFIATYNEDLEVLEKTIAGALALDWPRDRLAIHVLDDGRRDWLAVYCAERGVHHLTRPDNVHAKAGNINAAISRTTGEFFLVLDADFVPRHNFLFRAMGLFSDPKVGIVQIPHSFYNADPMQTNLGLRHVLPDDQRMFFGSIMSGRDGWDNAFCCGSNSITRRTAMEAIGNALPTGSITEDMLLTLALLRKGYVTRYLNERLAVGLAPESLAAMYVQRARWARGAIQMLFLRAGPFGPGLTPVQRIMFLPLHWLTQPLMVLASLLTPTISLWTGWSPMATASVAEIVSYQFPAVVATLALLCLIVPKTFSPLASMVHTALQAPRILPTVIVTLLKPHGHAFRVTPKGSAAGSAVDRVMVFAPVAVILATALGLYLDLNFSAELPMLALWAIASMLVLSIVQAVAISPGGTVPTDRFDVNMAGVLAAPDGDRIAVQVETLSMTGAELRLAPGAPKFGQNASVIVSLADVGALPAQVVQRGSEMMDISFELPSGPLRDALLRVLFLEGREPVPQLGGVLASTARLVGTILRNGPRRASLGRISRRVLLP